LGGREERQKKKSERVEKGERYSVFSSLSDGRDFLFAVTQKERRKERKIKGEEVTASDFASSL